MADTARVERRRLLRWVRDVIGAAVGPGLEAKGFQSIDARAGYRRDRDGVVSTIRLAPASRPPALGRVGILIEPSLTIHVPAWSADARARLSGPAISTESPGAPLAFELLDALVPGKRPHWMLSDEPNEAEIANVAAALREAMVAVGLPYLDRFTTPAAALRLFTDGSVRLMHDARFTAACGALLLGDALVARTILSAIGTARRQSLEQLLGLG